MSVDHPKVEYGQTGALIINLGTPDSTSWFEKPCIGFRSRNNYWIRSWA